VRISLASRLLDRLRAEPALAAILGLALVLNLIGIGWGLPNVEPWIADSVAGELTLKVWATYTISSHKYPYLHSWIAFALYLPRLLWWLATGQLDGGCWPYLKAKCFEADAFAQMGQLILISRLLSAAMALGTVWLTQRLARALGASRRAARWAALGVALSYVAVFYAHVGNLDGPMTFWYTLSLLAYVGILQRGRRRDYAAFGLASGAALGTKEAVIGAYVLVALHILWRHGRSGLDGAASAMAASESTPDGPRPASRLRGLFDRRMQALVGGLLLVYALSTNAVFNQAGFVAHWRDWLPGEARMQGYQQKRGLVEVSARLWEMLAGGMDLPLLLLCLAGLVLALVGAVRQRVAMRAESYSAKSAESFPGDSAESFPKDTSERQQRSAEARSSVLLVPGLSYLLFSVYLSRIVEMRVVLPLVPSLAVWGGLAADRLLGGRSSGGNEREGEAGAGGGIDAEEGRGRLTGKRRFAALALLALVYGHAGLHSLNHDLLFGRDARYAAEAWLQAEVPMDAEILAFGDRRYLPRLGLLGYTKLRFEKSEDATELQADLAEAQADVVIFSSRWTERFQVDPGHEQRAVADFFEALRQGEAGYVPVFEHQSGLPMGWSFDQRSRASGSVDPRITILRRR
jgi:hypothetical protein